MKYHLIIGFGKWSKKIISFLQKKKLFYKIYIKTRHYYFELDSKKKIHNKEFDRMQKKIGLFHVDHLELEKDLLSRKSMLIDFPHNQYYHINYN